MAHEILKSMVGQKVDVWDKQDEVSKWVGVLKSVDESGILLKSDGLNNDYGTGLVYIKHDQYVNITAYKKEQSNEGIFAAFRKQQDSLYD